MEDFTIYRQGKNSGAFFPCCVIEAKGFLDAARQYREARSDRFTSEDVHIHGGDDTATVKLVTPDYGYEMIQIKRGAH